MPPSAANGVRTLIEAEVEILKSGSARKSSTRSTTLLSRFLIESVTLWTFASFAFPKISGHPAPVAYFDTIVPEMYVRFAKAEEVALAAPVIPPKTSRVAEVEDTEFAAAVNWT